MTPEGEHRLVLPPRVPAQEATMAERRSWTYDALDALADARGKRMRDRGDSRFGTVYMGVVGVVVFTAMGGSLASSVFAEACTGPLCSGGMRGSSLGWLALALIAATLGAVAVGARALGPAGMSPARRSWLGAAPLDRALVVRDALLGAVVAGGVTGLVGGVLVALALGAGRPDLPVFLTGVFAGAAAGALTVLYAALVQASELARSWTVGAWLLLGLGIVGACVAVGPWGLPPVPGPSGRWVALGALAVGIVASAVGWAALRPRLRAVSYAELRRAGDVTEATTTSILMLETGPVDELRQARARSARGRFRSRPLSGRRGWAAVSADLRRLLRSRSPIVAAVLLLPAPILLGGLLGPFAATVVTTLAAIHIGNAAATGLRLWTRSTAIRRMFPWHPVHARVAHLVVPVALVVAWLALACATSGLDVLTWAVLALAVTGAVLRCAPESSMGAAAGQAAMVSTPMGAVPLGIISVLVRGPDVAAVPVLLLVMGVPGAAVAVALGVLLALLWRDA